MAEVFWSIFCGNSECSNRLRKIIEPSHSEHFSPILIFSAVPNGGLGLACLGSGIWICYKELKAIGSILPLHGWLDSSSFHLLESLL
ncbi:hypothetical protein CMV_022669 [Castanea mollissima]|uniref:ABCC10-like N-terminal domain-containing protein n=1 Tax=Castanea mollissima TaxID=60419 RepID=A0A8J4QW36_9ROSI|nr:hypothetical protein CMV_022669 [Castanea mollissima]